MGLEIRALKAEHFEDVAALVCARIRAQRCHVPLVPSRLEQVETLLPILAGRALELPGAVALSRGKLVGFLAAVEIPDFLGQRTAYSPEYANGAQLDDSRRIYEELYGHVAGQWVEGGWRSHVVTMLAHDAAGIETWHWFGFGLASVDGLRGLEPVEAAGAALQVRRAGLDDLAEAAVLQAALEEHLAAAPIFWEHELGDTAAWLRDPVNALWLAEDSRGILGCLGIGPGANCTLVEEDGTAAIVSAFTWAQARGQGVATALLNRALAWARTEGYERCAVDWEPMNYLASRFWTRWFTPVCFSLLRHVLRASVREEEDRRR